MSEITDYFYRETYSPFRELLKKIEEDSQLNELEKSEEFGNFIKGLEPLIDVLVVNNSDWKNNTKFQSLFNEINEHFTNEVEKMIVEGKTLAVGTKLAVTLGFVGIAIGAYYAYRQYEKKRDNESGEKNFFDKGKEIVANGVFHSGRETMPVTPSYKTHTLLLVILANQLPKDLNLGKIDNNTINELISGSSRFYCFENNDEQGNHIMNAISCSDDRIDSTTEINVFVGLEVFAENDITSQRNKLNIKEKISSNSEGKIFQLKKLESARSVSKFYPI